MTLARRGFLHLTLGAAALPAVPRAARGQAYPTRPVRLVVTFPPGGANDIHARLMGQWLSERLGQPFVVENRAGGGGNLGAAAVARSPADGHTLLLLSIAHSINRSVYEKLNYDLLRDIAPVAGLYRSNYVMLVSPAFPARTVPEFIAYVRANSGKINMASNGMGATGHLAGEMFKMMTGVSMLHVPYRGEAPALTDLIAGQVQVMFTTMTGSIDTSEAVSYAHWRSLRSGARKHSRTSLHSQNSFPVTSLCHGSGSVCPELRPRTSSTSSTKRSMRASRRLRSGASMPSGVSPSLPAHRASSPS